HKPARASHDLRLVLTEQSCGSELFVCGRRVQKTPVTINATPCIASSARNNVAPHPSVRDVSLSSARSNAPFDTSAAAAASTVPAITNAHARSLDREMSDRKIWTAGCSPIFLSDIFLSDIFLFKKPDPPCAPRWP